MTEKMLDPLAKEGDFCYNRDEKQKCGSLRALPTPASLRRWIDHLHNGPVGRTAWILYDSPALHARGGFAVLFVSVPQKEPGSLRCVGFLLHGVFVFHPASGYSIVKAYVSSRKMDLNEKATVRFETMPGKQGQM
ncbi:MAG: hypothetical protein HFF80_10840, partial [Oscillospiraceae bacterium]|nr:hypothetical protein [Oscillospiraceae bacterium]